MSKTNKSRGSATRSQSPTHLSDIDRKRFPCLSVKSWMVFGSRIKIVYVDGLRDERGRDLAGVYLHYEKKIKLNSAIPAEEQARTLFHELGHALMYRVGLSQSDLTSEQHELIVENFSNWMFETFERGRR